MDPLSLTVSITTLLGVATKVLGYIHDVANASKDQAKLAIETSAILADLTRLKYRVESCNSDDPWFVSVRALGAENGALDQYKDALEKLALVLKPAEGVKEVGRALKWQWTKKEAQETLCKIERLKTLILAALANDTFTLNQSIKEDTAVVLTAVANQELDTILKWLDPLDFPAQQSDFIGRRGNGTGQWLLESEEFQTWKNASQGILYCPDIPGSGKTMLTAIIVDHLGKEFVNSSVGVAYIYYNYKRQSEQTVDRLLASLLAQIIRQSHLVSEELRASYKLHREKDTKATAQELLLLLRHEISRFPKAFVLVDALDECQDNDGTRNKLIDNLLQLQTELSFNLLATSRHNPDIASKFRKASKLDIQATTADIESYVEAQLGGMIKRVQEDVELRAHIKETIVEAADGMFLLAQLYMTSLLGKTKVKAVKAALQNLTKASNPLKAAYDEALSRIRQQKGDLPSLGEQVLCWITFAVRPLTTTALQYAIAIEPGEAEFDEDNIVDVDLMLSACAGLVTVDSCTQIIRLVHYTTQKYLESYSFQSYPNPHCHLAETCLSCFLIELSSLPEKVCDQQHYSDRLRSQPFLGYARDFWFEHVRGDSEIHLESLLFQIYHSERFSELGPPIESILPTQNGFPDFGLGDMELKSSEGLHLAARVGFSNLIVSLATKEKSDINAMNQNQMAPLHLACIGGYQTSVQVLLDLGANTELRNVNGETPLMIAVK